MREIEFRGQRCSNGKWVYGYYIESKTSWRGHKPHKSWIVTGAISNGGFFNILGRYAIKDDTVCQFTGLHDKHGKKVFEGDILLWTRKNIHIEGRPIQDFFDKCIIYYDNDKCGFRFRCKLDCGSCVGNLDFSDDRAKESYIEVIGNIFDNPELMKGETA